MNPYSDALRAAYAKANRCPRLAVLTPAADFVFLRCDECGFTADLGNRPTLPAVIDAECEHSAREVPQ